VFSLFHCFCFHPRAVLLQNWVRRKTIIANMHSKLFSSNNRHVKRTRVPTVLVRYPSLVMTVNECRPFTNKLSSIDATLSATLSATLCVCVWMAPDGLAAEPLSPTKHLAKATEPRDRRGGRTDVLSCTVLSVCLYRHHDNAVGTETSVVVGRRYMLRIRRENRCTTGWYLIFFSTADVTKHVT